MVALNSVKQKLFDSCSHSGSLKHLCLMWSFCEPGGPQELFLRGPWTSFSFSEIDWEDLVSGMTSNMSSGTSIPTQLCTL